MSLKGEASELGRSFLMADKTKCVSRKRAWLIRLNAVQGASKAKSEK